MTEVVVRIQGVDAQRAAARLAQRFMSTAEAPAVQVQTTKDLGSMVGDGVAIASTVISSIELVRAMWGWWRDRPADGTEVTVSLPDGTEIEMSGVTESQFEQILDRYLPGNSQEGRGSDG